MLIRARTATIAVLSGASALVLTSCGGGHFKNEARAPVAVQLGGVITDQSVTVSPDKLGAGPIVLIISNQAHQAHTITLQGGNLTTRVGPINPLDTAKIQDTLTPGRYTVTAGSSKAVAQQPAPATLTIGPKRKSSSSSVNLP